MAHKPASLLPFGSFVVAVLLAWVSGPSQGLHALRAAAESTGECRHEGVTFPDNSGTTSTVDGVAGGVQPLGPADFNPARPLMFSNSISTVSKGKNASLSISTRVKNAGPGGALSSVSAQDFTAAFVYINRVQGPPPCCHQASIYPMGKVHGRAKITGALRPFTNAVAILGRTAGPSGGTFNVTPATGLVQAFWDDNCNEIKEGRRESVSVINIVTCTRDDAALPTHRIVNSVVQTQRTDFTETEAVQQPPVIKSVSTDERRAGGVNSEVRIGNYGFKVTKNFTSSTDVDNTATSGTYASLQAGGGAVTKIQPDTFADLSFDLDVVGETDVKESIIVDLKK